MVSEAHKEHPIDAVHDERDKLSKEVRRLRERVRKLVKENRNLMSSMLALFLAGDDMARLIAGDVVPDRMTECPEVTAWKRARKAKP